MPATKERIKIEPVSNLWELYSKANTDENYKKLLICASENLGFPYGKDAELHEHTKWLDINASETDEDGVVSEVNFCIDIIEDEINS